MFQVLRLLIERRGEIVSKSEFFEEVWEGGFVEDNNLTVTITSLRKVLGDNAKQARFIENIPRKGYRFVSDVETLTRVAESKTAGRIAALETRQRERPKTSFTGRLVAVGAAVILIVIMAIVSFGYKEFWPASRPATKPIDSIAVLPFSDPTAENEYLADGLTESIINDVSRITRLRVIDRNSAFHYKNEPLDAAKAGRELNVRVVVSGQVERQGDSFVINVEMFDAESNSQIWRQQFRRRANDLFAIQQEVSEAIAKNALSGSEEMEQRRPAKRPTNDPEAYELYLKGRYHWNKRAEADILRSIELFRAAIDRDPTFAKAYIGLADAYTLGDLRNTSITRDEKIALSRGAVRRALEIDDTIGEAYASMAINKCYYDWNFAGAESDYRKAVELSPNDATSHHWYAEFLSMQGRFDESYAEYEKALSLDPLSLPIRTDMAFSRYYSRDYDKAIELLNLARQIDPEYRLTYNFLMFTYREKGMFLEAINAYEQDIRAQYDANGRSSKSYINIMRHITEVRNEGSNLTAERYWRAELEFEDDPAPNYKAVAYAKLGEKDKAFEYLERAYKEHYSGMVWLKVTPELDGIRDDPRFQDLLKRVGFDPR
ncbi:MAG: winged helix-turn-helix domain-containing protein [Pyrinomonadaceae bacterium]|nr:winged helix-turn-helix domain-containing protein [Pyrinomonadaceae bacterium]